MNNNFLVGLTKEKTASGIVLQANPDLFQWDTVLLGNEDFPEGTEVLFKAMAPERPTCEIDGKKYRIVNKDNVVCYKRRKTTKKDRVATSRKTEGDTGVCGS